MKQARESRVISLATRLLAAHLLVLAVGSLTLAVIAFTLAPGIFARHLAQAGDADPLMRSHAGQAFDSALGIALVVGGVAAALTALVVSVFVVRRIAMPVVELARTADALAAGDFNVSIPQARLGREFERLTSAFASMADRLAHIEAVRRSLMADLAHEMRTPLTTLQAHVDGLEDGIVEPDAATWQVLRTELERLRRLAQDLAELSAAEEHTLSLDLRLVDLSRTAAAAVEAAAPRYRAKSVTLTLDAPHPLPVLADAVRVQQVLSNLLDNALRHTPATGTVQVIGRREAGEALVHVCDSGDGLPPGELDAVFNRFHRVDVARARSDGGSGLGLSIARAIIINHRGTLTAASAGPNQGSIFTIRLPADSTQIL